MTKWAWQPLGDFCTAHSHSSVMIARMHLLCSCFLALRFQGYQDVRDRMIHRSTSQGSISSPVYSRHSYTPTTARSPQHFHRPGKGHCSRPSLCRTVLFLCDFSPWHWELAAKHIRLLQEKRKKERKLLSNSSLCYISSWNSYFMLMFIMIS